jgi:hypothetical protein
MRVKANLKLIFLTQRLLFHKGYYLKKVTICVVIFQTITPIMQPSRLSTSSTSPDEIDPQPSTSAAALRLRANENRPETPQTQEFTEAHDISSPDIIFKDDGLELIVQKGTFL